MTRHKRSTARAGVAVSTSGDERASMVRLRRLAQIWSWLPAFRAAAELQHLPSAAKRLGVTPSSVSRAVRLLEQELGVELFAREGRRIVLTDAGRRMLSGVRDGMRLTDDAVEAIKGGAVSSSLRVWSVESFAPIVVRALARLARTEAVRTAVVAAARSDVVSLLLRGDLDVAFVDAPQPHNDLVSSLVVKLAWHVYAKKGAPFAAANINTSRRPADLSSWPFAVVAARSDPWPLDVPRTALVSCARLAEAAALASSGDVAVLLPDAFVDAVAASLQPVRRVAFPPTPIFAVHRKSLAHDGVVDRFVSALRSHVVAYAS